MFKRKTSDSSSNSSNNANVMQPKQTIEAGLIPQSTLEKLKGNRQAEQVAQLRVDRGRWFLAFLLLAIITLFAVIGWQSASDRFANNVRVAWVKLDPSGSYKIEIQEDEKPFDFFQSTLEAEFIKFFKLRYGKQKETIRNDYAVATIFMSPALKTQFYEEYGAAKVYTELSKCTAGCEETEVEIRVIEHLEKINNQYDPKKVFKSQIFFTETIRKDGVIQRRQNRIVTVDWHFRTKEYIVSNRNQLQYNPLGIEFISISEKFDPTPVVDNKQDPNAPITR